MNKLCNFMVLFMALSGNVYAQKTEPWNDPLVNNINRNEPVSDFFGYENKELSDRNDKKLSKRCGHSSFEDLLDQLFLFCLFIHGLRTMVFLLLIIMKLRLKREHGETLLN